MAYWLVAFEAVIYVEVEADDAAEAQAKAMKPYDEDDSVDITHIIDTDMMVDQDDRTPHDRVRSEIQEWPP